MSGPAARFKLVVAFDGRNYAGWQVQTSGVGVQELLEKAILHLFPGAGRVHSSSRTDAGVHALGMVAHVDVPSAQFRMPIRKLSLAINANLPDDIRVVAATRARPDFHARFDAIGKQYRYLVWNHPVMNPLWREFAWHIPKRIDLSAIKTAAPLFIGKHDFKSFAATHNYEIGSSVRTLTRCDIQRKGPLLTFVLEGDGFLYKMCRGIVGTLIQVGTGRFPPGIISAMLAGRDRRVAGMNAPAHGLTLWKVFYKMK